MFNWSIGQIQPKLTIVEPSMSLPALVGTGSLRRKFAIKLSFTDQNNQPILDPSLGKSKLQIIASGHSISTFTLWPISGGAYLITAELPPSAYPPPAACTPATPCKFDLTVSMHGLTATNLEALHYGWPQTEAVVLSIDKSASMFPFKLQDANVAAKALVASFLPPAGTFLTTAAGVVSFNHDADTELIDGGAMAAVSAANQSQFNLAIDGLASGGGTSIGDGVFEAQSALTLFDNPVLFKPDRLSIVLLSDGANTDPSTALDYLDKPFPPADDDRGPPWHPDTKNFRLRNGTLPVPVISSIAIGQDADLSELDRLARRTGGTLLYVQEAAPTGGNWIADAIDALLSLYGGIGSFDRVLSARTSGGVHSLSVETRAKDLRVTIASGVAGAGVGTLQSPSGAEVPPSGISEEGHSTTFRVENPEPGNWSVSVPPLSDIAAPVVLVEGAVRSPVQAFTQFDVTDALPFSEDPTAGTGDELRAWVGSDLFLRSAVIDQGPLVSCTMQAWLTLPDDSTVGPFTLSDDGEHGAGEPGDGLFGAAFSRTRAPGLYSAKVLSTCDLQDGSVATRETRRGVALTALPDVNGDGVPDRWAAAYALADLGDADDDGLIDSEEFAAGTNPRASDSDGGGESDGSEVAAGRNPRAAGDDLIDSPVLVPIAGNGLTYLPAGMNDAAATYRVQRAGAAHGPFVTIPSDALTGRPFALDPASPNDVVACYRMRAERTAVTSGWSEVACVTPRIDPVPPRVAVVAPPTTIHSRNVTLELGLNDPLRATDGPNLAIDLGVIASGVESIRVWFGNGPPNGVAWQPATSHLDLRLPDANSTSVKVQARDFAGNVSRTSTIIFTRPRLTSLDRALSHEERAQDLMDQGDVTGARSAILLSLPEVEQSFAKALALLTKAHGDHANLVKIVVTLAKIRALKVVALAHLKPHNQAKAREALNEAVQLEVALATLADREHVGL
ncbi:MAG: hypothetical protein IPI67_23440 [Myxococcales bacterium]|nr:hypothetical protein [Myxococcales bacterium]